MGLKSAVARVARRAGFDIVRRGRPESQRVPGTETHLPSLTSRCERIPGMINARQGEALYWMAYASSVDGDVIEIGSWQGRSTCYLAAACRDSGRGRVHAIDHFKGNPGKEELYAVGDTGLGDLRATFGLNVATMGLSDWVVLHAGSSEEVVDQVRAACETARLLFIDGEHSHAAVRRDLELYTPLLAPGGLLVLDDYSHQFPAVVDVVQHFLAEHEDFHAPVQSHETMVIRRA